MDVYVCLKYFCRFLRCHLTQSDKATGAHEFAFNTLENLVTHCRGMGPLVCSTTGAGGSGRQDAGSRAS